MTSAFAHHDGEQHIFCGKWRVKIPKRVKRNTSNLGTVSGGWASGYADERRNLNMPSAPEFWTRPQDRRREQVATSWYCFSSYVLTSLLAAPHGELCLQKCHKGWQINDDREKLHRNNEAVTHPLEHFQCADTVNIWALCLRPWEGQPDLCELALSSHHDHYRNLYTWETKTDFVGYRK